MEKLQQSQDELCYVCGHEGYKHLLICCSECTELAAHKYCIGIVPGSYEDKNPYWVCYYCSQSTNPETNDGISDDFSTSNCEQCNNNQIILMEEQPVPLRTVFPEWDHMSTKDEEPMEIVPGAILLVSPTGEATVQDESNTPILTVKGGAKPTKTTKRGERVRERELGVFGWRRSPRLRRRRTMQTLRSVAVC